MAEATEVVRTERVEVVDSEGRVRVVIGTVDTETGMVGVSVIDANGRERGYIVTDDFGCEAGVAAVGNNLAGVRVDDEGEVTAFLADRDGSVIRQLRNVAA